MNFGLKFWHILNGLQVAKDPSVILLNHLEIIIIIIPGHMKDLNFFVINGCKEYNCFVLEKAYDSQNKKTWLLKIWDYITFDKVSNSLLFNKWRDPLYLYYKWSRVKIFYATWKHTVSVRFHIISRLIYWYCFELILLPFISRLCFYSGSFVFLFYFLLLYSAVINIKKN